MTPKARTVAEWGRSNDKMTELEWLEWNDARAMLHGLDEIKYRGERIPAFVATFAESGRVRRLLPAELQPAFDAYVGWVQEGGPHPDTLYPQLANRPLPRRQSIDGPSVVGDALLFLVRHVSVCAASSFVLSEAFNAAEVSLFFPDTQPGTDEWLARQADRLRDVVGNPFRPVTFTPAWRTGTAIAIARQMYASRDFSVMPILADALQDAGCDNDDVLSHCRNENAQHVRGCWVVDGVLGRA